MVSANNQQGFVKVLEDDEEEEQEQARQQAWDQPPLLLIAHPMLLEMLEMLDMNFQETCNLTPTMKLQVAVGSLTHASVFTSLFLNGWDHPP